MYHANIRRSIVSLNVAGRSRALRQCTRRSLATATETDPLDIDFPPDLDSRSSDNSPVSPQTQAVFVRPWEGISSMPELLAMVRGLERHYGRIREYGVMRDFDIVNQYLPYFWVNFEDPASFARVPETPSLLKLDVPRIDLATPGGIGLEDLRSLLQAEDYVSPDAVFREDNSQPAADSTKSQQMVTVDIRVERAKAAFQLRGMRPLQSVNRSFLGGFYSWGGFYQLPAPDASHPSATMQQGVAHRKLRASRDVKKTEGAVEETAEATEDESVSEARETMPFPADATPWPNEPSFAASPTNAADSAQTPVFSRVTESADPALTAPPDEVEASMSSELATPRLSKREQILARARANARTPLPQSVLQPELKRQEEEEKLARERAEEEQVRTSVRERLWKLIGTKWS